MEVAGQMTMAMPTINVTVILDGKEKIVLMLTVPAQYIVITEGNVCQCILTPIIAVFVQRVGKVETVNAEIVPVICTVRMGEHVLLQMEGLATLVNVLPAGKASTVTLSASL
ncbi:uncharacterized protein LOC132734753 [Ruditapes philippinarum]|uniref:uncharacterized protein LOC132734753 n=1 Tax=Ruditapes philippinarum TaxID=129788 RepID=UPI00295BAA5B|nr:uncharacterized protein LOC132734753 [Ruditapes philippinarum]